MRGIAEESGVSLGNAYYYFRSKDEMILSFYRRLQDEQLIACEGVLATERSLKNRISGIIRAQMAVIMPYKKVFASLFKIAADPDNSLNPFSKETSDIREPCIQRFALVVSGSDEKIPDDLQNELPFLLWMYHLGIVLFWIYDSSTGSLRTYRLLELSSEIVSNLINLTSMPIMVPLRKSILKLIISIKEI